jgi:hypothetical protein
MVDSGLTADPAGAVKLLSISLRWTTITFQDRLGTKPTKTVTGKPKTVFVVINAAVEGAYEKLKVLRARLTEVMDDGGWDAFLSPTGAREAQQIMAFLRRRFS